MAASITCPNCGTTCAVPGEEESQRVVELETQVRILTEKAAAAVDKLADYEDELRRFKSVRTESAHTHSASGSAPLPTPPGSDPTGNGPPQGRFSSLLGSRKPSTSTEPLPQPSSRRESDLQAALAREQSLRQQAEGKVTQMDKEIEDLSVTLFQQANEMVAKERKARAKLEERVETLEKRDVEKRKRLERLESAVKRIDRVNKLLAP